MPKSESAGLPNYRALLNDATQLLSSSSDSPRIDAEVLMQKVVASPMAWLIAYGDTIATAEHITEFSKLIEQRHRGHPVAYLVGQKEFWSISLKVNDSVLVPRADTETLVETALAALESIQSPKVLDLGTGSGAIALAIAKERPDGEVIGTDVSDAALAVAIENAGGNKIENVRFIQSDWYSDVPDAHFDLIAANPPYLSPDDPHLGRGDLRFEPQIALSAEEEGYADLNTIIAGATQYLGPDGKLILEHGFAQAEGVHKLLSKYGFTNIELHHDLNDLPRCSIAEKL